MEPIQHFNKNTRRRPPPPRYHPFSYLRPNSVSPSRLDNSKHQQTTTMNLTSTPHGVQTRHGRNAGRMMARLLFFLVFFAVATFLLQHWIINRISKLNDYVPYKVEEFFANSRASLEVSAVKNNSKSEVLGAFHTCVIGNRTLHLPVAPHFIIAGAQKSGTTALFRFLEAHPNLIASNVAET
jgi:hypothetical protein